ncbi:MAG TPA: hypothetical protein DDY25_00525 [Peptococcaceae bacterium]|jgi:hypothetical protein|nr:hypothetical protein [Peptococcaceae bacterium]
MKKEGVLVMLKGKKAAILGEPTFAGPLAGVSLGIKAYHIFELKEEIAPSKRGDKR